MVGPSERGLHNFSLRQQQLLQTFFHLEHFLAAAAASSAFDVPWWGLLHGLLRLSGSLLADASGGGRMCGSILIFSVIVCMWVVDDRVRLWCHCVYVPCVFVRVWYVVSLCVFFLFLCVSCLLVGDVICRIGISCVSECLMWGGV